MKKRFKTAVLLLAALLTAVLLSGCTANRTGIGFMEDGTVRYRNESYVAEDFFVNELGTTPQEYFKTEIENGKELVSLNVKDKTYWGLAAEIQTSDSLSAFEEAMKDVSAIDVSVNGDGVVVTYNVPSIAMKLEESGESATLIPEKYADMAVEVIELYCPGGWVDCVFADEAFPYVFIDGDYGDQALKAEMFLTDQPYSVSFHGRLGDPVTLPFTAEGSLKPVERFNISFDPQPGGKIGEVPFGLQIKPEGSCYLKPMPGGYFNWYRNDGGDEATLLGSEDFFEAGKQYAVEFLLCPEEGFYFDEGITDIFVNESTERRRVQAVTTEGSESVSLKIWYVFDPLEGMIAETLPLKEFRISIPEPKAGEVPESFTDLEPKEGIAGTQMMWLVSQTGGSSPDEWEPMEHAGMKAFEEGYYYALYMTLDSESGYSVTPDAVAYINGKKSDQFMGPLRAEAPDGNTFARITHNYGKLDKSHVKEEAPGTGNPFTDVKESDYYYDAVDWAFNSDPQVTDGTSATTFSPAKTCTRGQVVTFLWRAAGCPEPKTSKNPFSDVKESDYFYKPVLWAVEKGITDGTSPTTFSPARNCTNAHILTFIFRAAGEKDETGGQWWEQPLKWATEKSILNNTGVSKANINSDCPRKNVVQFLYLLMD
ncbi:MAG: S-layer homology domain-containing protein [Firmicutes bacterium]|nr:S-layer homology domain-containing protein [Bacillota bacterium]